MFSMCVPLPESVKKGATNRFLPQKRIAKSRKKQKINKKVKNKIRGFLRFLIFL